MECPGCHADAIRPAHRLRVALRAQLRCPVCGVQVRLSLWPRVAHTLLGDLSLLVGFLTSLQLATPAPLALSIAWWIALALALPVSAAPEAPPEDEPGGSPG